LVLELVVDDDEVVRRLSGRRTCRRCGHVWHVLFDPPSRSERRDDCGGERVIPPAALDAIAAREIRAAGAVPSFQGYHGYPATICTSVNDQIVHGIPSAARSLNEGDLVSIDCGAIVRGWHGDAAVTVGVGAISAEHAALLGACEDALWQGLAEAGGGARLGDISHAVESRIAAAGPYRA